MTEPIITDEYLARLNPPDLTKLPQPDPDEVVTVTAMLFAELLGIIVVNTDGPDDLDDRERRFYEVAYAHLAMQAPQTKLWFGAREDALNAWVKTL